MCVREAGTGKFGERTCSGAGEEKLSIGKGEEKLAWQEGAFLFAATLPNAM